MFFDNLRFIYDNTFNEAKDDCFSLQIFLNYH